MAKSKFQQAMLIGIGIMVAIGFSGVFTYGGLVNTNNSPSNDREEQSIPDMPSQNFIDDKFDLSVENQVRLSVSNDVVFANVMYEERNVNYSQLSSIPNTFDNKVYINSVNTTKSTFATRTNAEPPIVLIIGGQGGQRTPYTILTSEISEESIISGICQAMSNVSKFGATCYS